LRKTGTSIIRPQLSRKKSTSKKIIRIPSKSITSRTLRSSEARLIWSLPDEEGRRAVEAGAHSGFGCDGSRIIRTDRRRRNEGDREGFSGGDRTSIDLPAPQGNSLRTDLRHWQTDHPVLMNGSALESIGERESTRNLEAWYRADKAAPPLRKRSPAISVLPAACPSHSTNLSISSAL